MSAISDFLRDKMSMTDVYQPVVIKELLQQGGSESRNALARVLSQYDLSVTAYYKRVLMRWPKTTLMKHGVVDYDRREQVFRLLLLPDDEKGRREAIELCDEKIQQWLSARLGRGATSEASASIRYRVLKTAGGKCQLCGISASISPIDIDHIIPRSKANKFNKVLKDGVWIDADSITNLQALCFRCNRAKRASDETDFRRTKKLVRDKVPDEMRASGRRPIIKTISGAPLMTALCEKLAEEHAEFLSEMDPSKKLNELADIIEVAVAIAAQHGLSEPGLSQLVHDKRAVKGGFFEGAFYLGDE